MRLRERLLQELPDLHATLERSWKIAHEQWLPALAPSQDSFNSYPHLRNLEAYLEDLNAEYVSLHGPNAPPMLSPLETYVLLASILLHDIGRVQGASHHGARSKEIVERHYAELGVGSPQLAKVIGGIVEFHDKSPEESAEALLSQSETVSAGSYGEIRQRLCSSLLLLVDHLDSATTRVAPAYVRPEASGIVAAFRRAIATVLPELQTQSVKILLSEDLHDRVAEGDEPIFDWFDFTINSP